MRLDILCVGSVKEDFYRQAVAEYSKRLSRYGRLNIYEVKDEKTAEHASEKEIRMVLKTEAERLEKYLVPNAYLIALAIEGTALTSEDFSKKICELETGGTSHLQFMIGGSLGIDEDLKKKADLALSFSAMTLPHQLMRVVLLEQIYRAYKIKNHEPYHK